MVDQIQAEETEQLCPVCECSITPGEGYEKEGVIYCCEACANGDRCECGCCEEDIAEEN